MFEIIKRKKESVQVCDVTRNITGKKLVTSRRSSNFNIFIPMVQPITTQMEVKRFPKMKRIDIKRKITANENAGKSRTEES